MPYNLPTIFCHSCFSEIDSRLVKSKLRLTSNISAPCKSRGCNSKNPETSRSHSRNATAPHLRKAGKMQSSEARLCLCCWSMQQVLFCGTSICWSKSHTAKTVFKDSNCRAFNLTIATMWASDPLICVTKAAAGAYVTMNKCIHIWIFQVTMVAPCNRGHMSHLISLRRPQPLLLVLASEWNPSWRLKMSLRISRQSH